MIHDEVPGSPACTSEGSLQNQKGSEAPLICADLQVLGTSKKTVRSFFTIKL